MNQNRRMIRICSGAGVSEKLGNLPISSTRTVLTSQGSQVQSLPRPPDQASENTYVFRGFFVPSGNSGAGSAPAAHYPWGEPACRGQRLGARSIRKRAAPQSATSCSNMIAIKASWQSWRDDPEDHPDWMICAWPLVLHRRRYTHCISRRCVKY